MECNVCISLYNKTVHKKVQCPKCNYEACKTCYKRYLLESPENPHCMNCRFGFSSEFLNDILGKTFCNKELRDHLADNFLQEEESLLPATQIHVERKKQIEKARLDLLDIKNQIIELNHQKWNLHNIIYGHSNNDASSDDSKSFVRSCPNQECRGFLNKHWKCSLCSIKVCSKCHVIKEDPRTEGAHQETKGGGEGEEDNDGDGGHVCKKGDIETAELLAKNTKPCPKCSMGIFKISGCSQMFCTSCSTAFCWNTGKITNHNIHNPHYFEYQAKIAAEGGENDPRTHGDIPCGGFITSHQIHKYIHHDLRMIYSEYLRFTLHVYHVTIPYYNMVVDETRHRDLRVRYMMNEISRDSWRQRLKRLGKRREQFTEIHQIYDMFCMTMHDLLMRAVDSSNSKNHKYQKEIVDEIKGLIGYVNINLKKIGDRYDNMVPIIFELQNSTITIRNNQGVTYHTRIKDRLVPEI